MRKLIALAALGALACAVAIGVAGPGVRMGLWDFGAGLKLIRQVATPIEIIKGVIGLSPIFTLAGLSALGGVVALIVRPRALGVFALACAVVALGAAQVPLQMKARAGANPFIHDITTDFANPPAIIAAAELDRLNPPDYLGDELVRGGDLTVAQAQAESFPDIAPRKVNAGLDATAEIVRDLLVNMNMEILDETLTDEGWHIEAAHTSSWFGFIDDFVVRLTREGSMTRVDVRSKSRVGGSDLGANAERVRDFFKRLEAATA